MVRYKITGPAEEVSLLCEMLPPQHTIVRWQPLGLVVQVPSGSTLPALCAMFPTLECRPYGSA